MYLLSLEYSQATAIVFHSRTDVGTFADGDSYGILDACVRVQDFVLLAKVVDHYTSTTYKNNGCNHNDNNNGCVVIVLRGIVINNWRASILSSASIRVYYNIPEIHAGHLTSGNLIHFEVVDRQEWLVPDIRIHDDRKSE